MGLSFIIGDRPGCWATLKDDTVRLAESEVANPPLAPELVAPIAAVQRAVSVMELPLAEALVLQVAFGATGNKKLVMTAANGVVTGCDVNSRCPTTRPPPDPVAPLFISGASSVLMGEIGMQVSSTVTAAIESATRQQPEVGQIFWLMRVVAAWTRTGTNLQSIALPDLIGKFITIPIFDPKSTPV